MAAKKTKSKRTTQPEKPRRRWPSVRWDWIAAAFSLLLLAWLVTEGDWDFFPQAGFLESFYDAQAGSLLHGRIDVPREAIDPEAFLRAGKAYGYFGPAPALARIPLDLLPGMYARWNRLSMLLASVLAIAMLLLLLRKLEARLPLEGDERLRNLLNVTFIFAALIGSTNFFVSSEAKAYQEAIIWGSALSLAQAVFLACFLMDPKGKWLALTCSTAFLAFFSRISSGFGAIFSLFLIDIALFIPFARFRAYWTETALPRWTALVLTATLIATAALWAGLNYWKFGTVFVTQPIQTNPQFDQARLQKVKGELVSLSNLPPTLVSYLSPSNIKFMEGFPWIDFTLGDPALATRFPNAHLDKQEPFASLPSAMPELLLAALAGSMLCLAKRRKQFRALRASLCGALAGCMVILTFGHITYRYLHDTFAWLLTGSAIAVASIPSIRGKLLRRGLAGLFVALTAYAMWANFAFAFKHQRTWAYPTPSEKSTAYFDLANAIDSGGFQGFFGYLDHWRGYIPADKFQSGNLIVDRSRFAGRGDQPVVLAVGQSPFQVEYAATLPAAGVYELDIHYASAESRPVRLSLNGHEVSDVCGAPTGGWIFQYQTWSEAGAFRLGQGMNRIALTSNGAFPHISMLRLIRLD
jgi:hypothetical protein